ncbi:hypothetical protein MBM_09657 [Drepanopeziza brunnea f. sp. 'multigermtubi' MB_m1]|uniref:Uncharacterized protein n=1 Tax=Marssonina brunnea f. sp. multigermtubi (strain MB_m1) TaxID=1072389 RepID=K1WUB2_MARBU|nr:uncharacterized protein MBM_09657 [Drepanopeziza brunnea f. sp. 'multigermtubi' MB_m1]EKD12158.1 hypothetical protein MBM_09657 [Drepanopeziza brunnea f. sp. 'multigermtubi' MB_m1]
MNPRALSQRKAAELKKLFADMKTRNEELDKSLAATAEIKDEDRLRKALRFKIIKTLRDQLYLEFAKTITFKDFQTAVQQLAAGQYAFAKLYDALQANLKSSGQANHLLQEPLSLSASADRSNRSNKFSSFGNAFKSAIKTLRSSRKDSNTPKLLRYHSVNEIEYGARPEYGPYSDDSDDRPYSDALKDH